MATTLNKIDISLETDLKVIENFSSIITAITGDGSLYIKAKETLDEYFKDNNMTSIDKATMVSTTISNLTIQSTQAALTLALEWAVQQKKLVLDKTNAEYELASINQGSLKLIADTNNAQYELLLAKAKMIRDYGAPTVVNGEIVSLADDGESFQKTALTKQQTENELTKNDQIKAQTEELYARVHQLVADTYVNHGMYSGYAISGTGITGITRGDIGHVTLSEMNAKVGQEQAKGYTYNAWANAVSSSASMLATLISTESNVSYDGYLTAWKTVLDKLSGVTLPTAISTGV